MAERDSLQGQVAVVTGGGRGIGAAISTQLARMGAQVIVCGRSLPPLEKTTKAIEAAGGKALASKCDLTDLNSVESLAAEVKQKFGRLDILVNNAGIGAFAQPLH